MTEFPLNNLKVPFLELTANLKINLRGLEKKHNKELNELYQSYLQDATILQEHLTQSEMLEFMELNSVQIGNIQSENLTDNDKIIQAKQSVELMKQMKPYINKIEELAKEELEIKHLIEYVRTCVDTKTAKKDDKLFKAISKDEFWLDVPLKQLQEIKESFRK